MLNCVEGSLVYHPLLLIKKISRKKLFSNGALTAKNQNSSALSKPIQVSITSDPKHAQPVTKPILEESREFIEKVSNLGGSNLKDSVQTSAANNNNSSELLKKNPKAKVSVDTVNNSSEATAGQNSIVENSAEKSDHIDNVINNTTSTTSKLDDSKATKNDSLKNQQKEHAMKLARQMDTNDFKAFMILNMSEIRTQLKALTLAVSKSSADGTTRKKKTTIDNDDISCEDDTLHGLPAIDHETWQQFNDKLSTDLSFRKAVAQKLKDHCFGYTTLQDFVRAALGLVLTNSLASEFSWAGMEKKKSFHGFYFIKLLSWVLKHCTKFPRVKNDLKSAASAWLRLAPQRAGGLKFHKYRKPDPSDETARQGRSGSAKKKAPFITSTPSSSPKKKGKRRSVSVSPSKARPSPSKEKTSKSRKTDDSDIESDILPESDTSLNNGNASLVMYEESENEGGYSIDEAEGDPHEFDEDND